jgi:hypothetical protein
MCAIISVPAFHAALGVDTDWYAHEVFRKTSESRSRSSRSRSISTIRAGEGAETAAARQWPIWPGAKAGRHRRLLRPGLGRHPRDRAFARLYTIPAVRHSVCPPPPGWSPSTDAATPWIAALFALFHLVVFHRGDPARGAPGRKDRPGCHGRAVMWGLPALVGGYGRHHPVAVDDQRRRRLLAFLSALAIWGWIELAFLTGIVTGPNRTPLPEGPRNGNGS